MLPEEDKTVVVETDPKVEEAKTAEPAAEAKTEEVKVETKAELEKPKDSWKDRRIAELTQKNWSERSARQQAENETAALRDGLAKAADGTVTEPAKPQAPLSAPEVERRAAALVAEQRYNEACNRAYEAGRTEFTDFDDKIKILGQAGVASPQFLGIVTEMPEAAKLLHYLGDHPDEAQRFAVLPPLRLARELTLLEQKLVKPKAISQAPAPITPVGAKTATAISSEPEDSDDMATWVKKRNAQLEEKRRRA